MLAQAEIIELGCGSSGGIVDQYPSSQNDPQIVGIDIDLTASNADDIGTEAMYISTQIGLLMVGETSDLGRSSYPHYDAQTNNFGTMLWFLLQQIKKSNSQHAQDTARKIEEIFALREFLPEILRKQPELSPSVSPKVTNKLIQADAVTALQAVQRGQLQQVIAHYFFNNLKRDHFQRTVALIRDRLANSGELEIVVDQGRVETEIRSLVLCGMNPVSVKTAETKALSRRTQAIVEISRLTPDLDFIPVKIVLQKA